MENKQNIHTGFPGRQELLDWYRKQEKNGIPEVNGHIHSPESFSAFSEMELAFQMALNEGVRVLGINDFYTLNGYPEFASLALKYKVFPLFNVEFMALQDKLQQEGIRVNDPNNPGRTYFSGKGLRYPVRMSDASGRKMSDLQKESNRQTYQMVERLNAFLKDAGINLYFDAAELHRKQAKGLFRERHIAQAIRETIFELEGSADGRMQLFNKLFSGKDLKSPLSDIAAIENEIRGNLLKAGGAAFVPEDPKAFLTLEEVKEIIIDAGGIPCYPVLLDDASGKFTEYESNKEKLMEELLENEVYSIELIPGRNDCRILKDFASFFYQNGFVVTFGTEHNTPQLDPLRISCRGGVPLDEELKKINYEGAAVIAAHQYLQAQAGEGYLSGTKAKTGERNDFAQLGKAVMAFFFSLQQQSV
jgi:hypothetical protein